MKEAFVTEDRKERSRQRYRKKSQRRVMMIVCIALGVMIVFSVNALGGLVDENSTNRATRDTIQNDHTDYTETGDVQVSVSEDIVEDFEQPAMIEPGEVIERLWYYDESRAGRYEEFAGERPDLTEDEVYWMVDCDLDMPTYKYMNEVPDPNDILLLVNKHFYLPESYEPDDLISVGDTKMRKEAGEALKDMIDAASEEGHRLWSQSRYRSYSLQSRLFNDYSARDGVESAETYSARPGHSEHQTGLTTDLNTITEAFGDTGEGRWVAENSWEYGFIIRYTRENREITQFIYEPWHIRYIGKDAAADMRDKNILSFEEYWVKYVKYQ